MAIRIVVGLLWLGLFSAYYAATITNPKDTSQILLVVSFDSFNSKYLEKNLSPNLKLFQEEGASVPYLKNVFPTKTLPNHFSIATGTYPDKHGVVNNEILDKTLGKSVRYGQEYYHMDNAVTPIWTHNELNGGHSACLFFPGTNFLYHNRSCTFTEVYSYNFDFQKRVDLIFKYINDPKTPANLVMVYFEQPDDAAHKYGTNSKQVQEEIAHVDKIVSYIKDGIKQHNLESKLNVIFLSDHGMITINQKDMIDLRTFTNTSTYQIYGSSPVLQVVPNPENMDSVLQSLRAGEKSIGHFHAYTNTELPKRWHYRNDQRVGPITIVADLGYVFNDFYQLIDYFKSKNVTKINEDYGMHGYDNEEQQMNAIFMAKGPAFKARFKGTPCDSVDLFYLFCKILKLKVPPNLDGNGKNIEQFLASGSAIDNKIRSGKMLNDKVNRRKQRKS